MPDQKTTEEMMADISARAAALAVEQVKTDSALAIPDETKIREWFGAWLAELPNDDPLIRKIRFPDGGSEPVISGKFARWGLGPADIEFLYDLQAGSQGRSKRGGGTYQGPSEELTRAFKTHSDATYLSDEEIRHIDRQAIDDLFPRVPKNRTLDRQHAQQREAHYRAMDTAESGFGLQLIGAQYVGDLWEASRPESRIDALINTFEMTAPVAYLPVEVDIPKMRLMAEATTSTPTALTSTKTGSNRVQVNAVKFGLRQLWSGELEEDAIIPFVPFLRRQAALGLAHYSDSLVLNGDTTATGTGNINQDDEAPAADDFFLAFDGIRHAALVDNTANAKDVAGVVSVNLFRDLRGLMMDATNIHDWGHPINRDDLVFICDPETADRVELLDEVMEFKKMNNIAPILGGEAGRVLGHPVIGSMAMSKTEADGKVSFDTPANNVFGQIAGFNRRGIVTGWLRRVRVETDRDISTDQNEIVYTLRRGLGRFTPTGAASGIEWAVNGYGITI